MRLKDDPPDHATSDGRFAGFVRVRGAREHNLKDVSLEIPRDALVVFTGVSGSGKSSLAFGTLYAEAQRRYLESVSPYARRLFHQLDVPEVDEIDGLPPAVALQQQRGSPSTRSSVGSVTTLSNLLRMLYSRAGDYPAGQPLLYAESFSPNTPEGACPTCHGLGRTYEVTEASMVPDDSLTIRQKAIASWPPAWYGQSLRDILVTLGYDVDKPWRELSQERSRLDLVHRRAARRPGLRWPDSRGDPPGDPRTRPSRATRGRFPEPGGTSCTRSAKTQSALDAEAGLALHDRPRLPGMSRASGSVASRSRSSSPASTSPRFPASPSKRMAEVVALLSPRKRNPAVGPTSDHPEKAIVILRIAAGPRGSARGPARPRPRLPLARPGTRPRSRPASCNGSGSPPRSAPTCSAWSTCSTSPPPGSTRPTPKRCSGRSTASKARETPCSSSSTTST